METNETRVATAGDFTIETITPSRARDWLVEADQRGGNIRKIRKARVNMLADEIRRGRWRVNGESIKFDETGTLIDGQHRLSAIVAAGVPVETAIVRGLRMSSVYTIDQHSRRTLSDYIRREGCSRPAICASILRTWCAAIDGHDPMSGRWPDVDIALAVDVYRRNSAPFLEAARYYDKLRARFRGQGNASVMGYMWLYSATAFGLSCTLAFYDAIAAKEPAADASVPAITLRNRLARLRQNGERLPAHVYRWVWARAVVAHANGEDLRLLTYRPGAAMPKLPTLAEIYSSGIDVPDRMAWDRGSDIPAIICGQS